jgi:hypothetical protein
VKWKVWGPGNVVLPWVVRWHLWRTGHTIVRTRRVGRWVDTDITTLGLLIVCECGKEWAY